MIRICWFSARFVALYALLLWILAVSPLEQMVGRIVGAGAAEVLELCAGQPTKWSVSSRHIELTVAAVFSGTDAAKAVCSIETLPHIRNLPLFAAVVLAAARRRNRSLVGALLAGSLFILVLDAVIVAAEAWETISDVVPLNRAYHVLAVFSVFHTTGAAGMFAAPVFLGALAVLAVDHAPVLNSPGRNDRCPCGSGRKWKRCCGG